MFSERAAAAQDDDTPSDSGRRGRRYIIRGGHVMSMDPSVGDFAEADVLIEGKKIAVTNHGAFGAAGSVDG